MNDHNEKQCTEIHVNFDFHVTVLTANEGAKDHFEKSSGVGPDSCIYVSV